MVDAIEISRYILNTANINGDLITNLKLQKILYYAQAWYLVNFDKEKLFEDNIEAWQYGPVIPSVYNVYKGFNRKPIEIEIEEKEFESLSPQIQTYLDEFCERFLDYSATQLVSMTHNEQPWQEAYQKCPCEIINLDSMYSYYKKLLED
ncbi:MAG: DUF4065 domain-containing protein [Candidatus Gastranaerophilales bacterium]|nr:DUF4065 domain-containing protein [Candidatus Gastranaerophilales bacterium]